MTRLFRESYRELFGFKMRQNVAADRPALANAKALSIVHGIGHPVPVS
jgi:hypothetical protein